MIFLRSLPPDTEPPPASHKMQMYPHFVCTFEVWELSLCLYVYVCVCERGRVRVCVCIINVTCVYVRYIRCQEWEEELELTLFCLYICVSVCERECVSVRVCYGCYVHVCVKQT